MANSKPILPETEVDLTARYNRDRKKQFGILRQNLSASTPGSQALSGSRGSSGGGSGNQLQDSFLKTAGDTMVGAFATAPVDVIIQDDSGTKFIDIGATTTDFSSNVIVLGEAGLPSDLNRIDNFAFAGQWLLLQAVLTTPITLKHDTDNIWIPSLSDYTITGGENVLLKYDSINARWTVVSNFGGSGSGGDGCPPICDENELGTVSGAVTVDWSLARLHRMILAGDVTITFTNLPTSINEQDICIEFQQDSGGGHSVTWNTTFANGKVPVVLTGGDTYTSFQFYAYEEPAGTSIVQAFDKTPGSGVQVPGQPGVFGGFGGYIHAGLNFDQQSNLGLMSHIEFDKVFQSDTITVSTGSGQASGTFSGFRVGHVYQCTCYLAAKGNSNLMSMQAQFYDINNGDFIGSRGHVQATTEPINDGFQPVAVAFFTAESLSATLEVRFRDVQNLDKVLNGASSSESACTVIIKDCGVTEEIINQPAPIEGELDIREMVHTVFDTPNSTSNRWGPWGYFVGNTSSPGSNFKALKKFIIKRMICSVNSMGSADREIAVQLNGVDVPELTFIIPGSSSGLIFNVETNVIIEQGDIVEWRTSGGTASVEKFQVTALVWWL